MEDTDRIREKLDIVSYINEFVTLKRAGRNFTANCPFHSEKTPSFSVSPERQRWHCFGCQKGGDIFTFLMEYEHVDFPEALRLLAKRAGVTLSGSQFDTEASHKREAIYTLNNQAARYYHYVLTKLPAGKEALAYLKNRGITDKVIESFLLGFAPNSRRGLSDYLIKKKGVTKEALWEAGLTTTIGSDTIDFFRSRIMFPLLDHRDNIVGFSGRTTDTTGAIKAKYINTRETLVYHKGEMFYGLQLTKDAIRKSNQVILVEGEFDLLSCFQNGVGNVVGVKGTALTEKQVQLLSRYATKVTVCFDGDRAGQAAIKRSLPILEKYNLQTTIIVVPDGKDPDEAIKENPTGFKQLVKNDVGIYDFLLDSAFQTYDRRTAVGKGKIASELLPTFGSITNEIIKEHYLKKLSNELDTTYESLQKEFARIAKKEQDVVIPQAALTKLTREEMLEEYLLALLLQADNQKRAHTVAWEILEGALLPERAPQKVLAALQSYFSTHEQYAANEFVSSLPSELHGAVNKASLLPLSSASAEETKLYEIKTTAQQLRELYLKKRIKDLGALLKKEGQDVDPQLQEQFASLVSLLKK